jgi:hypothetical protein
MDWWKQLSANPTCLQLIQAQEQLVVVICKFSAQQAEPQVEQVELDHGTRFWPAWAAGAAGAPPRGCGIARWHAALAAARLCLPIHASLLLMCSVGAEGVRRAGDQQGPRHASSPSNRSRPTAAQC